MIPIAQINAWQIHTPWQNLDQIEQDLIISRALIELFGHDMIREKFAFRGGTALNKLFFPKPARYSEDIDLVQIASEPIGESINIIRGSLDQWLGEPSRKFGQGRVTLTYSITTENSGNKQKLKLEINTREHFSILGYITKRHRIDSPWFAGEADVKTYKLDELLATKLRALYQRKKGRDLFDLWFAYQQLDPKEEIIWDTFKAYLQKEGKQISRQQFLENLSLKINSEKFLSDIKPLLATGITYDPQQAYQELCQKFFPEQ